MPSPDDAVTPATCAELRRAAKRGTPFADLADAYRLPFGEVIAHVRGECSHTVDEPAAPFE